MRAYERLLKYVSVYTTSDPDSATVPSSMRQYDLAHQLVEELKTLGLENVHVDENCVVYGWLSATAGCEKQPRSALSPYGYRTGLRRRKRKAANHRKL